MQVSIKQLRKVIKEVVGATTPMEDQIFQRIEKQVGNYLSDFSFEIRKHFEGYVRPVLKKMLDDERISNTDQLLETLFSESESLISLDGQIVSLFENTLSNLIREALLSANA